ncbi:hypothetical protein N9515_08600 [Vicingaceae bacterium]|nr:hypothetical protein [Vicingaceae bacterium]MDB4061979.1 hypothetical protein [Vicingaceae bacterium]
MRLLLSFTIIFFASLFNGYAQESAESKHVEEIKIGDEKRQVNINYSFKQGKENETLLKVQFFNKTKVNLNVDLVMGFYNNGVLLEKVDIADCLKKSFFNNFFRPFHLVGTSFKEVEVVEIEILNFYSERVDECRETHK